MTVLLTAPARLALMLVDAHVDVVSAYSTWQDDIDTIQRPAWLITHQGGEALRPEGAVSSDLFSESYRLEFFGKMFGMGLEDEYELQARSIVASTIDYFRRHPQLQFSNERGLEAAGLPVLQGVQWINLQFSPVTLYKQAEDDAFWGGVMTINITGRVGYSLAFVAQ